MFESIEDIIKYSRRDEKKKQSNQMGLFDNLTGDNGFDDSLQLKDKVKKMSFENMIL
jgi:hypothetical protein